MIFSDKKARNEHLKAMAREMLTTEINTREFMTPMSFHPITTAPKVSSAKISLLSGSKCYSVTASSARQRQKSETPFAEKKILSSEKERMADQDRYKLIFGMPNLEFRRKRSVIPRVRDSTRSIASGQK